ncbi:hypothetical protein [Paraburkholderia sp. BL6665CI2N2]|nr:hypothetical protein [Paraburkholderia sp. BL6665CI2N2]
MTEDDAPAPSTIEWPIDEAPPERPSDAPDERPFMAESASSRNVVWNSS